jgi:hypothetical protein
MKLKTTFGALVVGLLLGGPPALAHHSFAMFDREKQRSVEGVVSAFQWTNPHIWVEITVTEKGKAVTYAIEGASPNSLARRGWTRTSLKPGEKITLVMNPLKNGQPGGSFVRAVKADGSVVGDP